MPIRAILAAILVACCWGGNYTATKFALEDFPPYLSLLLRFIGVVVILAPFALRPWLAAPAATRPRLKDMALIGLMLIVLQFACVFTALDMGLSITSAVVASQLGVPFACMLAAIVFKDFLGPWRSFGLMVAFLGVLMVAGTPNASEHWDGFMLAVLGAMAWSSANIYLKRISPIPPVVQLLFWPALFAVPMLAGLSYFYETEHAEAIRAAGWSSWAGIAYSLCFSSLLGYGLWNRLITRYPMSAIVPYSLLVPVVGIAGGVIAFGDPLTMQVTLGAFFTIAGVAVIALRRPQLIEREGQ
jgi:O-acetylserine/cysteine efflux transporter